MTEPAEPLPWRTATHLVEPEEREILWRAGQLFWTLHGDQADVYRRYRVWEKKGPGTAGLYRRIFVMDCARRYGKDRLCFTIKLEDAQKYPGSIITYATAFQKDIGEIVIPLADEILELDCPDDIRPVYQTTKMGQTQGYYFPNGSVIKLVGIDKNPNGLRGRGSDGVVVTEAAYCTKLEKGVVGVLYPQFQGRPRARMILQSTAPETPHHPYDTVFCKDAKKRGAYVFRTIDDNPLLDQDERDEFIDAAGGREHPTARREYYGERVREAKTMLVPEFDEARHVVKHIPSPEWADTYVAADPGIRDLCGLVWAFWDAERQKLCVQSSWAERNAGTSQVAAVWTGTEQKLWGVDEENGRKGTRWWDGTSIRPAPYFRVSDTDLRMLADLQIDHDINVQPADKNDSKEASLFNLRQWFFNDRIEIDAVGGALLIEHLIEGQWNDKRTDYLRSEEYGHFDLIDALRYLVRHVDRERMARPPDHILDPTLQRAIIHSPASPAAKALSSTIAKRPRWKRGGR